MNVSNPVKRTSPSDEAVLRATGRERNEWFSLLDAWGGASHTHRDIAAWIMREHGIGNWWAQMLTVDYERVRGLRRPGSRRNGMFAVTASITVRVAAKRAFEPFLNAKHRQRWLPGVVLRERASRPGRSARFDFGDRSTRVNVGFAFKSPKKIQVAIQHERLPNARAAKEMKAFWRERLGAFKELLEEG